MKNILKRMCLPRAKRTAKGLLLAFVLLSAGVVSAHADDDRNWGGRRDEQRLPLNRGQQKRVDRDWNNHEWNARRYWSSRPYYYQPQPRVVYAPPLVYAPPEYEQPSFFSFIFPLNIR